MPGLSWEPFSTPHTFPFACLVVSIVDSVNSLDRTLRVPQAHSFLPHAHLPQWGTDRRDHSHSWHAPCVDSSPSRSRLGLPPQASGDGLEDLPYGKLINSHNAR
jgi:hypothetical protein